jgi:hypothetical protein
MYSAAMRAGDAPQCCQRGPGMPGLKMRIMRAEARGCARKEMPVLAKEIALAKPKLRGDGRCEAQNVTNEPNLAMRGLDA